MFCEESFGEINAKDVELFQKESVHEFYRLKALISLEQVDISVVKKGEESQGAKFWWGGKLIVCCKLSLYAIESCDEHVVFLAIIEMMLHVHHTFAHGQ